MEATERIEPGAEAAHRDDLARDVARLWLAFRTANGVDRLSSSGFAGNALANALGRLEVAYAAEWAREGPHPPRSS